MCGSQGGRGMFLNELARLPAPIRNRHYAPVVGYLFVAIQITPAPLPRLGLSHSRPSGKIVRGKLAEVGYNGKR